MKFLDRFKQLLIDCTECGHPKSGAAKTCPRCGAEDPYILWRRNVLAVVILAIIIIIGLALLGPIGGNLNI